MTKEEINKAIKAAFWDYNIDPNKFYSIAIGKSPASGIFTKNKILLRLLERLSWYELIDLFGIDFLKENLKPELISLIRVPELRERYESVRKFLHGEALSGSGWSDQNRKRL